MATLVLGAVGRRFGGPVGAAVGALVGNRIDHALFGARREGPRLTELAVQTSSYGTPIPLVFGTMRVAGTVIWSTDLIEHRDRQGGGKGGAASTSYSYSASFAVALSARRVADVRRIWADGRLLRGAAGDWKVKATFRLHEGGEDQPPDPLIASAEGAETPAYRGIAYAVFEDLPLAEFGNRIPSITFEVVADVGGGSLGAIARVAGGRVDGDDGVVGFAASGRATGVLEVAAQLAGGWWTPGDDGPTLVRPDAAALPLVDAGATAAGLDGPARARRTATAGLGALSLAHYDPARDYQAGLQRAGAPSARAERVEVPAVLDAGAAKALAVGLLARAAADRVRRTVTADLRALAIPPGAVVMLEGERWRVVDTALEAMAVRLRLAPLVPSAAPSARAATSGRVAASADAPAGATLLRLAELPSGDQPAAACRVAVVAAGEGAGWRRAATWWSADDGASWVDAGEIAAPGVLGTVEAPLPPAPATLIDRAGALVVRLAREDMALRDADRASLDRGANLAAAGGELFQFGRATPLGQGRWRLDELLRGRGGTPPGCAAGDGFALLDGARTIEPPAAAIGATLRVMASGAGDERPAEALLTLGGLAVRPPSPVKLRWARADGGATLRWTRRSRAGARWVDGVDAPLGEELERYRVTLSASDGTTREVETSAPTLFVAEGETVIAASVRQRGTWAESTPATIGREEA